MVHKPDSVGLKIIYLDKVLNHITLQVFNGSVFIIAKDPSLNTTAESGKVFQYMNVFISALSQCQT